jgi:hypothetical protein
MTAVIDTSAAERLCKLCGMFGSAHDGERASAAAMADKLVRSLGVTWPEIIRTRTAETIPEKIGLALANIDALSVWERDFLYSISGQCHLSAKQLAVLDRIIANYCGGSRC